MELAEQTIHRGIFIGERRPGAGRDGQLMAEHFLKRRVHGRLRRHGATGGEENILPEEVGGGIDVTPVMGSRSTYTRANLGGLEGRALRAGDCLPVGEASPFLAAPLRLPAFAVSVSGRPAVL